MKQTKIEELYSSFTKQDINSIEELLRCQAFDNNEILISIHSYFAQNITETQPLDKKELFTLIYGAKAPYNDLKLRVYLSKMTKLLEKYIVLKNYENFPIAELNILNNYYKRHHLDKSIAISFKSLPESVFQSYEEKLFYDYQYNMRKLDYVFAEFSNDNTLFTNQFEDVLNSQAKYKSFLTLKGLCEYLNFSQKFKYEKDMSKDEMSVLDLIEKREELEDMIQAYLSVYLLLKNTDESEFLNLKNIVLGESLVQFEENNRAILTHLQNFCIKMINSGKSEYLAHLFDIYKYGLKYYVTKGDLNSANFRNIVFCALQTGQLDWAEQFIEKYHIMVDEDELQNSYNFNYARIYFQKKEYKKSMRQLLQVTYEDPFYASTARILLIKCYFELNDTLPLLSCCSSLNQFFHRNKSFTPQRIENNLHFIKFIKSIHNHRLSGNIKYYKQLKSKILLTTVVEKDWLISKIDELME